MHVKKALLKVLKECSNARYEFNVKIEMVGEAEKAKLIAAFPLMVEAEAAIYACLSKLED